MNKSMTNADVAMAIKQAFAMVERSQGTESHGKLPCSVANIAVDHLRRLLQIQAARACMNHACPRSAPEPAHQAYYLRSLTSGTYEIMKHEYACPVYTGPHAVLSMDDGVFKPSRAAQRDGWQTVQAKSKFQRWMLRAFF